MRGKPFRIINPWLKALAIVATTAVFVALGFLVPSRSLVATMLWMAASLALTYGLTRIFRVREEPVVPPRAWWRATGRPTAGWVLGGFSALAVVFIALTVPLGMRDDTVVSLVGNAATATFYVHSSIRLSRQPVDRSVLPTRSSDW